MIKRLTYLATMLVLLWSCGSSSEETSTNNSNLSSEENVAESSKTTEEEDFIDVTSKYEDNSFHMTSGEYKVNISKLEEEFTVCDMSYSKNGSAGAADPNDYTKCFGKLYNRWDDALNDYYKQAKPLFNEDLKKSQLSWLKFRTAEVDFLTDFYKVFHQANPDVRVTANSTNVNLVEMRTYDLINWLDLRDRNISDEIKAHMNDEIQRKYGKNTALLNAEKEAVNLPDAALTVPFDEAAKQNDKLLNENYKQLMNVLKDENLKAKLKTAQQAWLEFKKAELQLPAAIAFHLGGNSFKEGTLLTDAKMTYRRAMDLKQYIDNYSK